MDFLVLLKLSGEGVGETADENKNILRTNIIPSIEILSRLEGEGKLRGGFFEGQRSASFIVTVPSEKALDDILAGLPLADIFGIEAIPLESLEDALKRDHETLRELSEGSS